MTYYQDWPCELGVTIRTNITRRCQQSQDKWEDSGGRDLKLQLYLITLYVIRTWVVYSINNITILVGPVPSTWVALWSSQEDTTTVVVWLGCRSTTRLAILGIFPNYSRGDRGMLSSYYNNSNGAKVGLCRLRQLNLRNLNLRSAHIDWQGRRNYSTAQAELRPQKTNKISCNCKGNSWIQQSFPPI